MQQKKLWLYTVVLVSAMWGAGVGFAQPQALPASPDFPEPSQTQTPELVRGLPDFSPLVDEVGASVVNIRTMSRVRNGVSAHGNMSPEMREFFEFFFDSPFPLDNRRSPRSPAEPNDDDYRLRPSGVGSGFIISADGYIMTNAHVVADADEIIVTLPGSQKEYQATVVGADKRTDVALVKIEGVSGLPVVRIGNVEALKVGEWVVAIGSPFGLDSSVTAGIVSAKQRDTGEYVSFIQSDVAINPGNSGGPLINMRGEVVGINSQIYSRSGGFMGISFSIPIDEAMRVARQLQSQGFVERGRIGVLITPITNEVAQSLGLENYSNAALVSSVVEDGPAASAGVMPGDVITEVNGQRLERYGDLPRLIGAIKPGERAQIKLWRMGEWVTVTVIVEAIPSEEPARGRTGDTAQPDALMSVSSLGVEVANLTEAQKNASRLSSGVLVVSANAFASRAGLREGDIILAVGHTPIRDVDHFNEVVQKLSSGQRVALLIRRNMGVLYITMQPR